MCTGFCKNRGHASFCFKVKFLFTTPVSKWSAKSKVTLRHQTPSPMSALSSPLCYRKSVNCHNNNNKKITTLIQRYTHTNLQARGVVHYQHQNPLDNHKKYKYNKWQICIHQYQNDKNARMKQTKQKKTNKKGRRSKVL